MISNTFTSRYLPYDRLCAECEKLGAGYSARQEKENVAIPAAYFSRRIKAYYDLIYSKAIQKNRLAEYEKIFLNDYKDIAAAMDEIYSEKFLRGLNCINKTPTVFLLMAFVAENSKGKLDEKIIRGTVDSYQKFAPFSFNELRHLKAACKYGLIKYLINLITCAESMDIKVKKAVDDAKGQKFCLKELKCCEYAATVLSVGDEKFVRQIEILLSDNGLVAEDIKNLFEYKRSDLHIGFKSVIDSLRWIDARWNDDLLLDLSSCNRYLEETGEENYIASDKATKLYFLSLISDSCGRESELTFIAQLKARYANSALDVLMGGVNRRLRYVYVSLNALLIVIETVLFSLYNPFLFLVFLPLVFAQAGFIRACIGVYVRQKRPPSAELNALDRKKTLIAMCCVINGKAQAERIFSRLLTVKYANPGYDCCLLCDFMASEKEGFSLSETRLADFMQSTAQKEHVGLIIRKRGKNSSSGMYEGYEKKRGALLSLCEYILYGKDDFYKKVNISREYENILTLDEDSFLYNADELCAVLKHPMNSQYAVAALCGKPYLFSQNKNAFTAIFNAGGGIDSYSSYCVNFERDVLNCSNYTGKGCFRIREFTERVGNLFEDNTILSHDFIEGAFAKTVVTNYDVFEDCPDSYSRFEARRLRWLRGDVQLLPYLFDSIRTKDGTPAKNTLTLTQKRHIFCNILSSFIALTLLVGLIYAAFSGSIVFWSVLSFCLTHRVLAAILALPINLKALMYSIIYSFMDIVMLPYRALADTGAAMLSIIRLIRKKNLMIWQTFAHAKGSRVYIAVNIIFSVAMATTFAVLLKSVFLILALIFFCVVAMPGLSKQKQKKNGAKNQTFLKNTLRDTWRFFEVQLKKGEYLISDNCCLKRGVMTFAPRTSPTNIGFSLVAVLCAYTEKLIDKATFENYSFCILNKVNELKKWHGHLYNWYDTNSGEPLYPQYVSAVDSGNFLACCLLVYGFVGEECRTTIDKFIKETDFMPLYDKDRNLLRIGYNSHEQLPDGACYDLMASEALLTYIVCVGYNKIPRKSLECLKKRFSASFGCLYSWTGGAFEYLMPWLFVKFSDGSVAEKTARNVVKLQKRSVLGSGIWGISESQYSAVDESGNFKYKAFGLSGIAFSDDAEGGVAAPYASIMCLDFDADAVLKNMAAMCKSKMYGEFGFYEAFDGGAVKSFMAHHQGMIMLAVTDYFDGGVRRAFGENPHIKSAMLQLDYRPEKEKFPLRKSVFKVYEKIEEQRVFYFPGTPPELNFMTDGKYYSAVNSYGGGWAHADGNLVYKDKAPDEGFNVGVFVDGRKLPVKHVLFNCGKSIFYGEGDGIAFKSEYFVAGGYRGEMRLVEWENRGCAKEIEIRCSIDFILAPKRDYSAHPEFNKLFITFEKRGAIVLCKNNKTRYICGIACQEGVADVQYDGSLICLSKRFTARKNEKKTCTMGIVCGYNEREILKKCRIFTEESFASIITNQRFESNELCLKSQYCTLAKKLLYESFGCNVKICTLGFVYNRPVVVVTVRGLPDICGAADKLKAYDLLYKFGVEFDIVFAVGEEYGYYNVLKEKTDNIIASSGVRRDLPEGCRIDVFPYSQGKKILKCVTEFSACQYAEITKLKNNFFRKYKTFDFLRLQRPPARFRTAVGYYDDDNRFVCDFDTGAPFSNIVACESGGMLLTNHGGGFYFGDNSREKKITAFDNESRLDAPSEAICFAESGNIWSALSSDGRGDYYCVHALGYSEYNRSYNGCISKCTIFLSRTGCQLIEVKIENTAQVQRCIDLCFAVRPVLGDFFENTACNIEIDCVSVNKYKLTNAANGQYVFIGFSGGDFGMKNVADDLILKMLKKPMKLPYYSTMLDIVSGGKACIRISIGRDIDDIVFPDEFSYAKKRYFHLSMFSFETDDYLGKFAEFLPYQTYCSRFYGRTGYYQVSGAYGFRDQLQDCLTMLYIDKEAVRRHILDCAAHQFVSGDVMHWWHAPFFGVRTRIMDDRLFLPYITAEYIQFTGECEILAQRIAFLKDVAIPKNSESVCDNMTVSQQEGSLLEHCKRAIFSVCENIADDGLVLMHGGDWNDAMNLVGIRGKGKSVWLTMFLYEVINKFLRHITHPDEKKYLFEKLVRLKRGVAKYYNGRYFARAVSDDGTLIGSPAASECKIDLLTQAYAAISGIAPREQCISALLSAEQALVDKENKLIKLFHPPFKQSENIGYICDYPPGIRENGGQYTHAAIWFIIALYKTGQKDKAYEYLYMLSGINHCKNSADAAIYKAEPYVLSADVYSGDNAGRAGWTWYTGAASWYYVAIVRYLFGITFKNGVITVDPALPDKTERAYIHIRFNGSTITVDVDNSVKTGKWHFVFNGVEYNTNSLDLREISRDKTIVLKRCPDC